MTTTTHTLDDFAVTDWTTLDYALSTHPIYADLTFKGSIFQQILNTRRLPPLFYLSFLLCPFTKNSCYSKVGLLLQAPITQEK